MKLQYAHKEELLKELDQLVANVKEGEDLSKQVLALAAIVETILAEIPEM